MAKHGSSAVSIYLEDAPGGTSQAIKDYILEMGSVKITSATEPSHAFGDSWEEIIPSGIKKCEPISLGGFFNSSTSAPAPHVMFNDIDDGPEDDGRALIVGFSTCNFLYTDVRATSYEVIGTIGKVTQFKAELVPTGTATWCTTTSGPSA